MTETTSEYIDRISKEFSVYVATSRAIPSVIDGQKSVNRVILHVLQNKPEKMKTFALAGLIMHEKLYVHGDSSLNAAISLMAAPFRNNICLVSGFGAFGNKLANGSGMEGIGAPRYTSVQRSNAAMKIMYIDTDILEMVENYDGSNFSPKHFLPLIPALFLSPTQGIAVGWSTNILPRSVKSIIQSCIDVLNGKKLKTIPPYYDRYNLDIYPLEKNQWQITGKIEIIDSSTLKITELPPEMKIETFRKKLIKMEENDEIVTFTDNSSENIDIDIKFKRGTIKDWTSQTAIDFFKLYEKVTERIVVLDWNGTSIKTYDSAEEIIEKFVWYRLRFYSKRYEKKLKDTNYELLYWLTINALFKSKTFISKLGKYSSKSDLEIEIKTITNKNNIKIDDYQLNRVVSLPTYKWTKDFEKEVEEKIMELKDMITEYETILASPELQKQIYIHELEELLKMKF